MRCYNAYNMYSNLTLQKWKTIFYAPVIFDKSVPAFSVVKLLSNFSEIKDIHLLFAFSCRKLKPYFTLRHIVRYNRYVHAT